MNQIIINNSTIFYTESFRQPFLHSYYDFVLSKLKDFCNKNNLNKSIALGVKADADITIGFFTDHNIKIDEEGNTVCNLHNYNLSESADWIITHHMGNIDIIKFHDPDKQDYINKCLYIPPIIYDNHIIDNSHRINDVCTLHHMTPRREEILKAVNVNQIDGIYDKDGILTEYNHHKILLNIHQNDTHRAFQEIRVLPALVSGLLIVSEGVPYKNSVPYNKHIIWSDIEDIRATLDDIVKNYETYRSTYLEGLTDTIRDLNSHIEKEFSKLLS